MQLRAKSLFRKQSVLQRYASSLVVGEHDSAALSAGTLSTITAASKIGGEVPHTYVVIFRWQASNLFS